MAAPQEMGMEEQELATLSEIILKGIPKSSPHTNRLLRARLMSLGDEIGEPILPEDEGTPRSHIRVRLLGTTAAMTPLAASIILGRR
jgi:hypothetical protein